eukprot:jgi/Tetstr1/441978/TSEL_030183.t1
MFTAPCQRKAGGKPKRGKTALLNKPEGSGDKEVTGDTDDEIEEIEEIEGTGDPAIRTTDGMPELEEAEVDAQQRQYMLQQAEDNRAADQLARSAADYDESPAWEAKHLAQRAFAQMERMAPRIAGIQIELDSNECSFLHHVSPLGLDKDQVLTMIKNGRAVRSKH